MSLWGNTDANTSAPKHLIGTGIGAKNIATANATIAGTITGDSAYQNTASSVFVPGVAIGVFGVDAAEKGNTTGEGPKATHAGWVLRTVGTGNIDTITFPAGGGVYNANGYILFTGGGGVNANASFVVNANGNLTSIAILNRGTGYNSAPTAVANVGNTAQVTLTVNMAGRVGRKTYQTLVAMGSMTPGANTDNAYFPD